MYGTSIVLGFTCELCPITNSFDVDEGILRRTLHLKRNKYECLA